MKRTTLLFAALCICSAAFAQNGTEGRNWSFRDCINYAMEHNRNIIQGTLQVEQREIALNSARNSHLPAVSAGISQNCSFGRGLTADNTYANTNTSNSSFSLGADMPIFQGLRISHNIALGKLDLEAATRDLENVRDEISIKVAQAYIQALYNREILKVANRQVEIDSLQVARLEALLENGKSAPAEVAERKASLAQSRLTAVQAGNNLQLSLLELSQLLELPSPEGFDIASPSLSEDEIWLPESPEAIYEEAVEKKAGVKAEESRLAHAERSIELARSGYLPTLSLNGGLGSNYYTSSDRPSKAFFEQLGNNFSQYVGLSLNIPIFSRLTNRNQIRSAKVNLRSQQLRLDGAKQQLFKEIQQAWYNARAAAEKYRSSIQAEEAASENFTLIQARYENGKATSTEFNEARNQYMKAGSDLIQARYEALFHRNLLTFYRGEDMKM